MAWDTNAAAAATKKPVCKHRSLSTPPLPGACAAHHCQGPVIQGQLPCESASGCCNVTPASAPSLHSSCWQGHLKIHVCPSHLKPAMASTALQSPAPTPSHPFSPPFTPLLQSQASRPPRKANSMQPRDLCTCHFIRPGCSARTLPSGPSPLSTHMSLPLRSPPSPPWLKWPL